MTNNTLEYLRRSGWSKERQVDISIYLKALIEDGYEINSLVEEFLKNYGGLEVKHHHTKDSTQMDKFHFNAEKATESYFPEVVEEYMERVNEKLVVVGMCRSEHMVVMLSHSGKMYAGFDEILLKLGDNIASGLVALCEGIGIVGVE